jgi:hypothetical protein
MPLARCVELVQAHFQAFPQDLDSWEELLVSRPLLEVLHSQLNEPHPLVTQDQVFSFAITLLEAAVSLGGRFMACRILDSHLPHLILSEDQQKELVSGDVNLIADPQSLQGLRLLALLILIRRPVFGQVLHCVLWNLDDFFPPHLVRAIPRVIQAYVWFECITVVDGSYRAEEWLFRQFVQFAFTTNADHFGFLTKECAEFCQATTAALLGLAGNWTCSGANEIMSWLMPERVGWLFATTFPDLEMRHKRQVFALLRKVLEQCWAQKPPEEIRLFFEHFGGTMTEFLHDAEIGDLHGVLSILVELKKRGVILVGDVHLFTFLTDWDEIFIGSADDMTPAVTDPMTEEEPMPDPAVIDIVNRILPIDDVLRKQQGGDWAEDDEGEEFCRLLRETGAQNEIAEPQRQLEAEVTHVFWAHFLKDCCQSPNDRIRHKFVNKFKKLRRTSEFDLLRELWCFWREPLQAFLEAQQE